MKYSIYLSDDQKKQLEYEVVSRELKVHLARLIARDESFEKFGLINQNWIINKSKALTGGKIYVLEPDDWGGYEPGEYAWHNAEYELALLRLDTPRLIEMLCEILDRGWLTTKVLNDLLAKDGSTFRLKERSGVVEVEVFSLEDIGEDKPLENEHANVRTLVARMEMALEEKDFSAVLHASASIFETVAKDIVGIDSVQDQTLGGFFERYKADSRLPDKILEKIKAVYKERNSAPLAGHGSTKSPTLAADEAVTLSELTKAFVRIEYKLQQSGEHMGKSGTTEHNSPRGRDGTKSRKSSS